MKKITPLFLTLAIILSITVSFGAQPYEWAMDAVSYCTETGILSGMENGDLALGNFITNEQTAKMLVVAFADDIITDSVNTDVDNGRWSYPYINTCNAYVQAKTNDENVAIPTTREEFVSSLVIMCGLDDEIVDNPDVLKGFADYGDVSKEYKRQLCIAVQRGYVKGSFGKLNPKSNIARAEACALIYRIISDLGLEMSHTPLVSEPSVSLETAKKWARNCGAADRFVDVADIYWKYGEITGLNPAILYAQAAKETGYGRYGGQVQPEQNNWAGIRAGSGDGFENFVTPEDGVRGHFNHIAAYVGLPPVGEPHGRYYSAASMNWAGTVITLEGLGGRWCPDLDYGYNILHSCLEPMMNTK